MHKVTKCAVVCLSLAAVFALLVCNLEHTNPLDPNNPNYIKGQIKIRTQPDSLFYTDSAIKIGIRANEIEVMDRIERIQVYFDTGATMTKEKPSSWAIKDLWCDSSYSYSTVGEKIIRVKVVTINKDDIYDTTTLNIKGRPPYIKTHPELFSEPFEEKDSLSLSVTAGGTKPLSYQWYRDTGALAEKTQSQCILPSLSLADSGEYYCIVSNDSGSDTSNTTRIRVIPQKADTSWPAVFFTVASSQGPENMSASVKVALTKAFTKDNVTVRLQVNASSTAGVKDYAFSDTVLQFKPNEVMKTVTITVMDDSVSENNETVVVDLKSAKYGVLVKDSILTHTYTINDNDGSCVQFASSTLSSTEKDAGVFHDSIAVMLTSQKDKPVTVNYSVIADSTTATGGGTDYTLLGSGTLTIPAFSWAGWIKLDIIGDTLPEKNETIYLVLSNPTGGINLASTGITCKYTIKENDGVIIAFGPGQTLTIPESSSKIDLAVSLSKKSDAPVTCSYKVTGGSASGAGVDYSLPAVQTLTFEPNAVLKNISLTIVDDTLADGDETIALALYSPSSNAIIGALDTVTVTIVDNEKPTVWFKDSALSGLESVTSVNIPVSLTFSPTKPVTVTYTIHQSTTAAKDKDYALAATTLVFAAGDTATKNINFTVTDDQINETDETVVIDLTAVENGSLDAVKTRHTYTITDNDQSDCGFSKLTYSILEKDVGAIDKDSLEVALSCANDVETSVEYKVVAGASTATGGGTDYTLSGTGKLTFPANTLKQYISLNVIGDTLAEGDETVRFELCNPTGGITIAGQDSATYIIQDNDVVSVSFNGSQASIDESGSSIPVSVMLSKASNEPVTVGYKVAGGSAQGGGVDFTLGGNGVLSFDPGELQKTIPVTIIDDPQPEPEETVIIELTTPSSNAALGALKTFTLTISDNERPVVTFPETAVNKYESETSVTIPVDLSFVPQKRVSVPFTVLAASTATPADFSLSASPLVFDSGSAVTKNITLTVTTDNIDETDETVMIELGTPTNATLGTAKTYTYTINNDDYTIRMAKTGDGTTLPAVSAVVSRGNSLSITARPSPYWRFTSWTATTGLSFANENDTVTNVRNVTTGGTVTANFVLDTHTVTVTAGDNGTVNPSGPVKVTNGGSLAISATEDPNYHFVVWRNEGAYKPALTDSNSAATTVNTITQTGASIKAIFAPNGFSVRIQTAGAGNGTTAPAIGTHSYSYGQEVELTATPYDSSEFVSWDHTANIAYKTGSSATTNPATFIINGSGTITANYRLKSFTVTVQNGSAGWGTVSSSGSVEYGKNFSIDANPAANYNFKQWTITSGASNTSGLHSSSSSSSNAVDSVKGPVTVQATFTPVVYQITIARNPSGAGSLPATGPRNIAYNDTFSITAAPNAGYTFTAWDISPSGSINLVEGPLTNATIKVQVKASGTLTANFSINSYTVTVVSSNANYGTVTPNSPVSVNYNGDHDIAATAKRGCKFSRWTMLPPTGNAGIADPTIATTKVTGVIGNVTVTANFDTIPAVTGVVYVDSAAGLPVASQDGSNWYKAYASLESGLAAGGNKEVWVAKGTYKPSTTTPFRPVSNSKIYGGFNAVETGKEQRNFIANRAVIDAGINNTAMDLLKLKKTVIDGFSITGSKNDGYELYISEPDSVFIINSIFYKTKNTSYGALYLSGTSVNTAIVKNCIFTTIKSSMSAPIYISSIKCTFMNTIFFDNETESTMGQSAGIYSNGAVVDIIHSAFVNNILTNTSNLNRPNVIQKINSSTLRLYNTIIWNDNAHSQGRPLINRIDSITNDMAYYCILDSLKVATVIDNKRTTWQGNQNASPVFVSLSSPGGTNNEKWFTSQCGLLYFQDHPGVNEGGRGVDYDELGLEWDIRGNPFKRLDGFFPPDIGPYEKQ